MPIVEVELPDGEIVEVDAPEGTTDEQIFAFVRRGLQGSTPNPSEEVKSELPVSDENIDEDVQESSTPEDPLFEEGSDVPTGGTFPSLGGVPAPEPEEKGFFGELAGFIRNHLGGQDLSDTLKQDVKKAVAPFIGEDESGNGKSKLETTLFGVLKTVDAPGEAVSRTLAHHIYEGGSAIITPQMVINGTADQVTKYKGLSDAIYENDIENNDNFSPAVKTTLGVSAFIIDSIITDPINLATFGAAALARHIDEATIGVRRIVEGLQPLRNKLLMEELLEEAAEKTARGVDRDTVTRELQEAALDLSRNPTEATLIKAMREGEIFDKSFSKFFKVEEINRLTQRSRTPADVVQHQSRRESNINKVTEALVGDLPPKLAARGKARAIVEESLLKGRSPKLTKEVKSTAKRLQQDGLSPEAALARSVDEVVGKRIPSPPRKEAPVTSDFTKAQALKRSKQGSALKKSARYLLKPVIDRIGDINPLIAQNVRRLSFDIVRKTTNDSRLVNNLYKKIPKKSVFRFDQAGRNGDSAFQNSLAREFGFEEELKALRKRLDEDAAKRLEYDPNFVKLEGFFPRRVRDVRKLRKDLGRSSDEFGKLVKAEERRTGQTLDADSESNLIDSLIRGRPVFERQGRTVYEVPDGLARRYESGQDALLSLFHKNNETNAIRDFTGGLTGKRNSELPSDLKGSVGEGIQNLRSKGLLTNKEGDDLTSELTDLLNSVLFKGRIPPIEALRQAKKITHITTIGFNPLSTIGQLGDLGVSAYRFGITNVIRGLVKTNGNDIYEAGLRSLSNDLKSVSGLERVERFAFRAAGFDRIDKKFGAASSKAAALKLGQLARRKNPKAFMKRIEGKYTPEEADQLLKEFKGETPVTDLSRSHVFSEVAEVRPVNREDMPKAWQDHPNGRVLYTLLSWSLKQANLAKKIALNQFDGNDSASITAKTLRGTKGLIVLTMFMAGANVPRETVSSWLKDEKDGPYDEDNIVGTIGEGAFAFGFVGRNIFEGVKRGAPVESIIPLAGVTSGILVKAKKAIVDGEPSELLNIPSGSRTLRYLTERIVDVDLVDAGATILGGPLALYQNFLPENTASEEQAARLKDEVNQL